MLNTGQAVIFTIGTVICMLLAARDVASGALTIGGFVMINAILMQLYLPLNFMGMVYREIKQGLIDIETMFALLHEPPEIVDRPGAKPLRVNKGEIKFENVSFAYDPERQILKHVSFEVPAGQDGRHRRSIGRRQIDDLAHPVPLLRDRPAAAF